jgi:hypothetical protein
MEATLGLLAPFRYGAGYPHLVRLPNPALGATATFVVPGSRVLHLRTARAAFKASAQVANRSPFLQFLDPDGGVFQRSAATGTVVASTEQVCNYAAGLGFTTPAASGQVPVGLPDLFLLPGMQINFGCGTIQTEDQFSGLVLYLEEFPTGPEGYPPGVE